MKQRDKGGEGNRDADRRYRKGVRETVEDMPADERAEKARNLNPKEREEARQAEEKGKSRARE